MPVIYSDRSLPISKNASNTLASTINLAWDFTGIGALANGAAWQFVGATNPLLVVSGESLVTLNGEPCRVATSGSIYDYTNTTDYGWNVGAGDFTIGIRINTSSTAVGTRNSEVLRLSGTAGTLLSVVMQEDSSVGWYFQATGACMTGSTQSAIFYPANTTVILWVRRISGQTSFLTQNATAQTAAAYRTNAATDPTTIDATWAARTIVNFSSSGVSAGVSAVVHWTAGLTDANITTLGKDFWSTNTNTAASDSIAITSPASGATIGSTATVFGTYVGTTPTGIDVQFGANAYVSGTSATIGSGTWTASFALTAGGPSALRARESNVTSIISPDVTGVTVASNSISFSAPVIVSGVLNLVASAGRVYQKNASNQASVRLKGVYIGTPTSIEYSWNGSAFSVLVASPSGGVFDQTVTLTGPAQGDIIVRFSNATGITATLAAIGVGVGFNVGGQSNHVGGGALSYVPPVAPAAHTAWVASIFDKTGVWRANVETVTDPFSKTTNASANATASAEYAVNATSSSAYGSYFGALATKIMAAGEPVAFVPSALGSTSIANWAVSTSTSTLYGAMLARAMETGIYDVVWWQGEADCTSGTTNTAYQAALNALINDWCVTRFPGARWTLMNLNVAGNTVGTGGTSGTDTGLNAIRAAIASVATSNPRVAAIGDMNTTTFAGIHYASSAEINAAANIAYTALNTYYGFSVVYATTVTFSVKDSVTGADITGLTNLDYAVFDQSRFSTLLAPIKKGSTLAVSAGAATIDITGLTTLTPGGTALVLAGPSSGLKTIVGQVVVS